MAWRNPKPQLAEAITGEWSRPRLWLLLAAATTVTLALIAGLGWSVSTLLTGEAPGGDAPSGAQQAGDELPGWLDEGALGNALPGDLSSAAAGVISLPPAASIGPAGVPSGFPRTREGALAQLAALDRAALESLSVPRDQQVITAWAAPGGPTAESWSVVAALQRLLSAADQPATGTTILALRADAAMGQFPEAPENEASLHVLVCVDLVLTMTVSASGSEQIAAADCQRMNWRRDRWVIAPGPEPDPTPSAWPGTPAALGAGYQWLAVTP
jgi:hypothetical protein